MPPVAFASQFKMVFTLLKNAVVLKEHESNVRVLIKQRALFANLTFSKCLWVLSKY